MRQRVGIPYTVAIAERLTPRDWEILGTLQRCRLATGLQLQRLHFANLTGDSARVVRLRVLRRLVRLRVIATASRRVGGPGGGAASPLYLLDTVGATLLRLRAHPKNAGDRAARRPAVPGDRFLSHVVTVTELYTQAVEAGRNGRFNVAAFAAEPAAWWTTPDGRILKPDAYLRATRADVSDRWWIEIDLGTESLPTVATKLRTYADFAASGATGPGGVLPAVLVTTPGAPRTDAIRTRAVPGTAKPDLFCVVTFSDAIDAIATTLQN